jgi:hypothetical protein
MKFSYLYSISCIFISSVFLCGCAKKELGEYVYIEPYVNDGYYVCHIDVRCKALSHPHVIRVHKDYFNEKSYSDIYCTICVDAETYKELSKSEE